MILFYIFFAGMAASRRWTTPLPMEQIVGDFPKGDPLTFDANEQASYRGTITTAQEQFKNEQSFVNVIFRGLSYFCTSDDLFMHCSEIVPTVRAEVYRKVIGRQAPIMFGIVTFPETYAAAEVIRQLNHTWFMGRCMK
jgi:RNA recognition motif-containing protein